MHLNTSNKIYEKKVLVKNGESTSYALSRNILYLETLIYLNIKLGNSVPSNLNIEHCALRSEQEPYRGQAASTERYINTNKKSWYLSCWKRKVWRCLTSVVKISSDMRSKRYLRSIINISIPLIFWFFCNKYHHERLTYIYIYIYMVALLLRNNLVYASFQGQISNFEHVKFTEFFPIGLFFVH